MARPKKNNAEYFTHDADMRNDVKIKALRRKFQHTGYAVWNFLLESLTDSDFFEIERNAITLELLAADYDIPVETLNEIIEYCLKIELLQSDGDNLYSEAHKRRFAQLLERRDKLSEAGKKGMAKRWAAANEAITTNNEVITPSNKVKESKGKESKVEKEKSTDVDTKKGRFVRPTAQQVDEYCKARNNGIDGATFVDYYESRGWMIGKNPMKDWQAAVRTWENKRKGEASSQQTSVKLGFGERIENGRRTYGTGRTTIPMSAPPRPSERYGWDAGTERWVML